MKTTKKLGNLIIGLLLIYSSEVYSQSRVEKFNTIGNLKIYVVKTFEDKVIAGTNSGIILTMDDGRTWISNNDGLPKNISIYSICKYNNNYFIGTNRGIFMSKDAETEWHYIKMEMSENFMFPIVPVFTMVANDSALFFGTPIGIYKLCYNPGEIASFTICNITGKAMQNDPYINCLLYFKHILYAGTNEGVFISKDKMSWEKANKTIKKEKIYSLAVSGERIYAGTEGDGIFVSGDNGQSWKPISNKKFRLSIYSIDIKNEKIYIGTDEGVYISNNEGKSWHKLTPDFSEIKAFTFTIKSNTLYIGTIHSGLIKFELSELVQAYYKMEH